MRRPPQAVFASFLAVAMTCGACRKAEPPVPAPAAPPVSPLWRRGELPPSALAGNPIDGGSLTVRIHANPASLNEITHPDLWVQRLIVGNVQEALVAADDADAPRFRARPALAESWEVSNDQRSYAFRIRKGVTFHDGHLFSARDVEATFDRIMDERVRAMHLRGFFAELDVEDASLDKKGYKALDDYTFRVAFRKPYFMTLSLLMDVPIQPKHLIDVEAPCERGSKAAALKVPAGQGARFKPGVAVLVYHPRSRAKFETRNVASVEGDVVSLDRPLPSAPVAGSVVEVDYNNDPVVLRSPVGTGPFKVVRWESDQAIELARNDEYWGSKPHLAKLVVRIVPNHTVATQLFERGEFDVMTEIQPAVWVDMGKTPRWVDEYHRIRFFGSNYSWIGWNGRRPFFKDARVRRAMTHVFDRDTFLKNALKGLEEPTTCPFFYKSPACDPTLAPLPSDPARARALLDEAGWVDTDGDGLRDKDGVPFRFTFLMPESSVTLAKLTPVLREALKKIGVDMDIAKVEWAVFMARVRQGDFDACSMLWGDKHAEVDPRQVWHSSQISDGSNFVAYRNPEVDDLIDQARCELDDDKRHGLFRRVHRILHEDQPYTWLWVRPRLEAVHRRVKGVAPTLAFYDFTKAWIDTSWTPAGTAARAGVSDGGQ